MDCDDATLLVAAAEDRTLTETESRKLESHAEGCSECRELLAGGMHGSHGGHGAKMLSIVSVPADALDDRDLLTLPLVDPSVFISEGELARGGMGRIVRARDRRLGRDIAIKEVLAMGLRARFEREVMITAQLQHPAIIPVYEAGTWPNGSAFYAMRLVSGGTLGDAIGKATALEERLALMPHVVALTDALAYAHSKRIVHRDLKPSNVLVGEFGETVVIDWGLAKEVGRDDRVDGVAGATPHPAAAELTIVGSLMGTPGYMPPEQGAGEEVDERADVYALGAILYNLLAGHAPYLDNPAITEAAKLIAAASEGPPTPIARIEPHAPRDLCVIVERAMARDRAARYPSAKDMADELRRFSAGQLLRSRAYPVRELAWRWVRRHRAAVSVAAIALAVLAVVAIVSVREIGRRREQAAIAVAHGQLEQGRQLLVAGDPAHAAPHLAAAALALPEDLLAHRLADLALRDVDRRIATLQGTAAAFSPEGGVLALGRDDGTVQLVDAASGRAVRALPARGGKVTRVAYAGAAIVTASPIGAFVRRDGGAAVELTREAASDVIVAGDRVIVASDAGVQLSGLDGANAVRAPLAGAHALDVSPDGHLVLALGKTETQVWALPALERVATLPARWWGRFDREGGVVLGDGEVLERFALASSTSFVLQRGQAQAIERLADDELATANLRIDTASNTTRVLVSDAANHSASLDASHLVTAGFDGTLRVWDLARNARPIAVLAGGDSTAGLLVDAARGRLASVGWHGTVELWDVSRLPAPVIAAHADVEIGGLVGRGGRVAGWLNGHGVDRAALLVEPLHPVPGWLADLTASEMLVGDGVKIVAVDLRDASKQRTFTDDAPIAQASASPSGGLLATNAGGRITLRALRTGAIVDRFDTGSHDISAIALDEGDHVVTGHDDGTIRIWAVRSRTATVMRGHGAHVELLALRGDRLLSGSWDQTVRAWSFPAGEAQGIVMSNARSEAAVSPDGRSIATVDRTGLVDVWESGDGRLIEQIATVGAPVSAAFVDDAHVAVGSEAGVLQLFEIAAPARSDGELARVAR